MVTTTVAPEVKSLGRYWHMNANAKATAAPTMGATYWVCGAKGFVSG